MPRILTLDDLLKVKEEIGFHWTWDPIHVMPKSKTVGKSHRRYFHFTCICKNKSWVEWGAVKCGRNMSCHRCSRMPTLEQMQSLAKKYGMLWKPTLVFKICPKSKRRMFRMQCACGNWHWVRWAHFQQGRHKGCRSCGMRIAKGTINDPYPSKHPIKAQWRRIEFDQKINKYPAYWHNFEEFKDWSIANGYTNGSEFVLRVRDKDIGYRPETCAWKNKNTVGGSVNMNRRIV